MPVLHITPFSPSMRCFCCCFLFVTTFLVIFAFLIIFVIVPVVAFSFSFSLFCFYQEFTYTLKNTTEQKNKEIPGREGQKKPGLIDYGLP